MILEAEDACEEEKTPVMPEGSIHLATPVSSPDREFDEGETLDPGESVTEPPLDGHVLSVQRCSVVADLVQPPWVGEPVSGLHTRRCAANLRMNMRGIIWFTTTQAFGSSVDWYPQTRSCKNTSCCDESVVFTLSAGHSRGLLRIAPDLEELAPKVLKMEMGAARERQSPREKRTGTPPAGGQKK